MNTEEQKQNSIYDTLGGADAVRRLVDRFYDRMDTDPSYAGIRALHPDTLAGSREKLYLFLCGWLGGPQLYVARHGHPRLRARHLPFAIGIAERDAWVTCMKQAMADVGIDPALQTQLAEAFFGTADFMRNRAD
jgi:hemoglobin